MIKPKFWSSREDVLLLVNAYLDGELDAAAAIEVERRINADASLKAEYDRLVSLRKTIASRLAKDEASEALRSRIAGIAPLAGSGAASAKTEARSFDWRQMAAAILIASCLASGATYLVLKPSSSSQEIAAIVAGHQRALLAAAPVDVASSDRHTVKPWFDGKLALSPRIIDLASSGFPLLGGRVDVIDGQAVPVLVYRHDKHIISVTAVPKGIAGDDHAGSGRSTRNGYAVRWWPGRDFVYYAVSDIAQDEFDAFLAAWHKDAAE